MDEQRKPRRRPAKRPSRDNEKQAKERRPRERKPENAPRVERMTREPAPETVYIPPEPFQRRKFFLQLFSVLAAVIALSFAMTVFFRVGSVPTDDPKKPAAKIMVSGTEKYTPYMVAEASGIKPGDSLLSFGIAKASGRITSALPYVKEIRIGIKLPDTVNIEVTEYDVVYAAKDQDGGWWLITAAGKVVEEADSAAASERGRILGVTLDHPLVGSQAKAAPLVQPEAETGENGETLPARPVTITGDQTLNVALTILQRMEKNNEIGKMESLDVSDLGSIRMWYGSQYEVLFGNQDRLDYKVDCMTQAVAQMNSYQSGTLDVSFTIWQDEVGYTPFE